MIAAIEDAIIARIQAASDAIPGLGYKLKAVKSYGGELDDDLALVVRSLPAVWVTFAGSTTKPQSTSRGKYLTEAKFIVLAGARNIRGERATRVGTTRDDQVLEVGVYQMLTDTLALLMNQDLGLAISPLKPGAVRTQLNTRRNGQALAVFSREWHTSFIETQPRVPIDPTDPLWLTLGMNYYLAPGDDVPDATDLTTLRA